MDRPLTDKCASVIPILDALHDMLGSCFEGVLHDFKHLDRSVVYIVGSVTGRSTGAPVTDLVLKALREEGDEVSNRFSYETRTRDGKRLKSSTVFLRDDRGHVVGCVCLNIDLTALDIAMAALRQLVVFGDHPEAPSGALSSSNMSEVFEPTMEGILTSLVSDVIMAAGKPVAVMDRDDKLRVVQQLDRRGAFLVKGAVKYVSNILGVSKYTLYSYLEELRVPGGDRPLE